MKKIPILITLIIISTGALAQKLSKAAIVDFSTNLFLQYKYGDGRCKQMIDAAMWKYGYKPSETAMIVEKPVKDTTELKALFQAINLIAIFHKEQVFGNVYSLGVSAEHAKEIAEYISKNFFNND